MGRRAQIAVKHGLDRVAAAVLLVVLSPLLGIVAAAVKLGDGGPVLFRHSRPGRGAAPFEVWKFRTMVVDADRLLDDSGRATENRVTPVGRILRATSLDELPQLVNIVRGEMSFVGPRPAIQEHLTRYTDEQMRRFRMRPGITGLAQISGRNTLPWSERIRLDNQYIDNYSLAMDARILLATLRVVTTREGIAPDRNPGEVDDLGPPRPASDQP
jgi:lipopolysaccharide/colanic/teichoic acid biosynthesis glycosyltransferase